MGLLLAFGAAADLGPLWVMGLGLTFLAIVYEHAIVSPDDLSRVNRAFFTVNGYVGIGLFVFGVLSR
jgi:4-hydroxybenzoate polyprenyltransferase